MHTGFFLNIHYLIYTKYKDIYIIKHLIVSDTYRKILRYIYIYIYIYIYKHLIVSDTYRKNVKIHILSSIDFIRNIQKYIYIYIYILLSI